MKTSILICATCFIVSGCSAQLRFPSLSSALSSLTGYGGSGSGNSNNGQSGHSSSPYSGLVRDYGRNLMMAMSSIYPTLFKPPQSQQQQQQQQPQQAHQNQAAPQSPFEQFSAASQNIGSGLFSGQSPSFSFGGSTFSISPSLPFGSLGGSSLSQQSPNAGGSSSPFGASFGSSINSPSSFGPLSGAQFLPQSMQSFSPSSSYNGAFDPSNAGVSSVGGAPNGLFNGLGGAGLAGGPSPHTQSSSSQITMPQGSNQINSFPSLQNFNGQHDSAAQLLGQQSVHNPQSSPIHQQPSLGAHQSVPSFNSAPSVASHSAVSQQFSSQQYRPDMMSIAASVPVPTSNSYPNYGNIPSSPAQQAPVSSASYQQPSYR